MEIYILKNMFAVCKIPDFSRIDLNREFYFAANTDEECSLVCPEKEIPADTTVCEKTSAPFASAVRLIFRWQASFQIQPRHWRKSIYLFLPFQLSIPIIFLSKMNISQKLYRHCAAQVVKLKMSYRSYSIKERAFNVMQ